MFEESSRNTSLGSVYENKQWRRRVCVRNLSEDEVKDVVQK
jgi:hypothetical protein